MVSVCMEQSRVKTRHRHRHKSVRAASHRVSDFQQFHQLGWDNMEGLAEGEVVSQEGEHIIADRTGQGENREWKI